MQVKNLFTYWTQQALAPGNAQKKKYKAFRSLLEQDKCAHDIMAELEEIHHHKVHVDFSAIEKKYRDLSDCVHGIITDLQRMHPSRYSELSDVYHRIDGYARHVQTVPADAEPPFCIQLTDVSEAMTVLAGGKAINLATLHQRFNIPTPPGFVITTNAFYRLIDHNQLKPALDDMLSTIDLQDTASLVRLSDKMVQAILQAGVPPEVEGCIIETFASLFETNGQPRAAAIRSSAVGEDSDASFAGQYKTVLNIGKRHLIDAYKAVLASKYAPEALVYRINRGLTDMDTPMAVLVVEMIDAAASGVMYTRCPDNTDLDTLEIHSIFGLGEPLVQGEIAADRYDVRKKPIPEIVDRRPSRKKMRLVTDPQGETRVEELPPQQQTDFSIDDAAAMTLTQWGIRLENDAGGPRDIEWCMDKAGQLFLLQSRPLKIEETTSSEPECRIDDIAAPVLLSGGERAAKGVASGTVHVVQGESDLANLPQNTVLVTRTASAHYIRYIEKVSAVISESGSTAGHFASVTREFGIPTLVNAAGATRLLQTGGTVTVYADEATVYDGAVPELLANPCIRRNLISDSPVARKLGFIMGFVSPLTLVDPEDSGFTPGRCRSLHDIIRFSHEAGTREMFTIGERSFGKSRGTKKIISDIPMLIYVMDVGGGMGDSADKKKTVQPDEITSRPFAAVWKGLNHPGIQWGSFTHFNWAEYDKIVMSGGIISAESAQLASYGVVSEAYVNLNLKFGYHFVILDALCSAKAEENQILFRFNGGGGDDEGRSLRAEFLQRVLQRLDFDVTRKSDLVDARFSEAPESVMMEKLDLLGRLLGATRLMDMYMDEETQVTPFVDAFMNGRYHFASVEMES